jgi:hypothetical protein
MLTTVATVPKSIEDYRHIIGDQQTDEILRLEERTSPTLKLQPQRQWLHRAT